MLACVGSRCWMSTKAMPLLGGIASRNFWNASSPPADAPNPTTGNARGLAAGLRFNPGFPFGGGRTAPVASGRSPAISPAFCASPRSKWEIPDAFTIARQC